jgi:hypothetical protein
MSNTPPIPEDMTPPWPAQPGPIDLPHADETVAEVKTKAKGKAKAKAKKIADAPAAKANTRKIAGLGAAIGIGSAAIVAALLYVNRPGKK